MSRRSSDAVPPPHKIFIGSVLTRDIFERIQKDKRHIMGYKIETKQLWVLSGLLLLFLLSLSGMIAMWFTNTFDNIIFSNLRILPDTTNYDMWLKPSPKPLVRFYLFNYTNVERFESGYDEKLHVQELGPYVYEITLMRVNTRFNDSSLSYQEQRIYKFMPALSGGRQNDRVTVPNIPLLTAASLNKEAPFLVKAGLSGLLSSLGAKPFLTVPAHRVIMGYEDNLYSLAKSYMRLQNQKPYEQFGIAYSTKGIRDDIMTINNGLRDINKLGTFERINSESALKFWSTDECNDFSSATDGYFFAPKSVRNKLPLQFYLKEFCRPLPLIYQKQIKILNGTIPAYRYVLPDSVFNSPDRTPENQCYCDMDLGACPPQGVFNATPCSFGAPFFMSYPHFYNADPALKEGVTGLNPSPEYLTYVDVHPTLGYTMTGRTRMQVNVQVAKSFGLSQVSKFEDGLMLPVSWFEYAMEDKRLPEDMVGIIFLTTFTLKTIELGLKYGSLLTMGVTLFGVILVLRSRWNERVRSGSRRG